MLKQKILIVLISVWVFGQDIYAQVDTINQELIDHIEHLADENFLLRSKLDDANVSISELVAHIDDLAYQLFEIYGDNDDLNTLIDDLKAKSNSISKVDSVHTFDSQRKKYEDEISKLKTEIHNFRIIIVRKNEILTNLRNDLDQSKIDRDSINQLLQAELRTTKKLKHDIKILNAEIIDLKSRVECVTSFAEEQHYLKSISEEQLELARQKYSQIYPRQRRIGISPVDIDSIISSTLDIYLKYQSTNKTLNCEGIPELEYSMNNLQVIDDFYLMRIFAFNEGNVIDKLNKISNSDDGRQKSAGLALKHLSRVIEKGNYDMRSLPKYILDEIFEIMQYLDFYIIPAKTKRSDISELEKIISFYNNGQYDSALSQYNKYRRFISTKAIRDVHIDLVHEIEFKMASILLWQLAHISKDKSIYPSNSWLFEISGNERKAGLDIIQNLMSNPDLESAIKRKCVITKLKMYDTI